jgi:hypothetical protein
VRVASTHSNELAGGGHDFIARSAGSFCLHAGFLG